MSPYVGMSINPSVTCVTSWTEGQKRQKKYAPQKNMFLMFLCLNKLPFFGYADTIKLCPYVRGYLTPLNPCFARFFTSSDDFFLGQKDKRHKRISHSKNMFLMFLCLNKLPFCWVCGHNKIVSLRERLSHTPQPVLHTYFYLA